MSQRKAAAAYNIPRNTVKNKLRGAFPMKPGHPTIFSKEEEESFAAHAMEMSDFGFPVNALDFWFTIKGFLDRKGRCVSIFKNNLPGYDWFKSFMKRHLVLSIRLANNIKR